MWPTGESQEVSSSVPGSRIASPGALDFPQSRVVQRRHSFDPLRRPSASSIEYSSGRRYSYAVRALDAAGNASAESNAVVMTTP